MGFVGFAHSPPLEHIEPTGNGHQFKYTRPQSTDLSSRPSTASGIPPPPSSSEHSEEASVSSSKHKRVVEHAEFVLEEIGTESEYNSETEVVLPDKLEEASSEKAAEERLEADTNIIGTFKKLTCDSGSDSDDEQARRYRQKKKRWSAGIFKRTHSQSVEGDSDIDDSEALDDHDVGASARRLRRRVRGPGDRSSLVFEDQHVVEVEEPDEEGVPRRPPSLASDIGEWSLEDFPFWDLQSAMEVESYYSRPSSRG